MCRQTSNALIYTPPIDKQIESNENLIETVTNLIEKNTKPCVKERFLNILKDNSTFLYRFLHR
jgi:hypothetical protein